MKTIKTMQDARTYLGKAHVTIEDLYQLHKDKVHLFVPDGMNTEYFELMGLIERSKLTYNDKLRAEVLIDSIDDQAFWRGYHQREDEINEQQ